MMHKMNLNTFLDGYRDLAMLGVPLLEAWKTDRNGIQGVLFQPTEGLSVEVTRPKTKRLHVVTYQGKPREAFLACSASIASIAPMFPLAQVAA